MPGVDFLRSGATLKSGAVHVPRLTPEEWGLERATPSITSTKSGNVIDEAFRKSKDVTYPPALMPVNVAMYDIAQAYAAEFVLPEAGAIRPVSTSLLQYDAGDYLNRHSDDTYHPWRVFTTVVGLSEFDGGDLVFDDGQRFHFEIGQYVIFPAAPAWGHRVEPVTGGRRIVLQTFWAMSQR